MSGYTNNNPRPYGNLSSQYKLRSFGGDIDQVDANLYFGPIVFESPTFMRMNVSSIINCPSLITYYSLQQYMTALHLLH